MLCNYWAPVIGVFLCGQPCMFHVFNVVLVLFVANCVNDAVLTTLNNIVDNTEQCGQQNIVQPFFYQTIIFCTS